MLIAYSLLNQTNETSVCVFEREDRLGGKIFDFSFTQAPDVVVGKFKIILHQHLLKQTFMESLIFTDIRTHLLTRLTVSNFICLLGHMRAQSTTHCYLKISVSCFAIYGIGNKSYGHLCKHMTDTASQSLSSHEIFIHVYFLGLGQWNILGDNINEM